jgi:lipid A 3-O-deacylase
MRQSFNLFFAFFLLFFAAADLAAGEELKVPEYISEVRGGFLKHDVDIFMPGRPREERGYDLNGEVLFKSPAFLDLILSPRPNVGATVNLSGHTDHAYAGLNWGREFENGIVADFFFGFAVHDGLLDVSSADPDRQRKKLLGSRILFHPGFDLGYRFDNGYGLMFFWEHLSNGGVLTDDGPNRGIDNWGLRASYRFDGL